MAERPEDDHLRLNLGMGLSMVASAHMLMGHPEPAAPLYEQAEAILGSLAARNQADPHIRSEWALMLYRLGQPKQALGNDDGARRCFERASSLMEDVLQRHSDEPDSRFRRALFEQAAADMQAKAGDSAGARERWKQSRREMAALLDITPDNQEWLQLTNALEARLGATQERLRGKLSIAGALERLRGAFRQR
jgi:tetratricopeptide (TPR) repeat protein